MKNLSKLEAQVFQSLSNPKRLEIVHLLEHGSRTVNEIVEMTGIPQATISQHLTELKRVGIVIATKDKQMRVYRLASPLIHHVIATLRLFLQEYFQIGEVDTFDRLHLHKDPVCGMEITAHAAVASMTYNKKRYYFCGLGCEKRCKESPERFLHEKHTGKHIAI